MSAKSTQSKSQAASDVCDSNEYKQFQITSFQDASRLHLLLAGRGVTSVTDDQLSQSVFRILDRILHLCRLHRFLIGQNHGPNYNESDLRQALDDLARHLWCSEIGPEGGYLFRSECALKLPRTDTVKIVDSTVDSVSFFFQPKPGYLALLPEEVLSTMHSITPKPPPPDLYLVHWVTEYKTLATDLVKRQVLYGMVSGLYQRRALGRLDDFVFGTAYSGSALIIYAARWERVAQHGPSGAGQPSDISNEGKTATDPGLGEMASPVNPATTAKERPGKSVPSVENTQPYTEATPLLVGDENGYEIVVYQLGEYLTTDSVDMIQFYLLMRASRKLADGYRTDLFTDPWEAVMMRLRSSLGFNWPSPPRPHTKAPSGLPTDSDAASMAYEPEDAAEWKEEWVNDQQVAIEECGPSSLKGLKSAKSEIEELGLDERVSVYLDGLSH